MKGLRPVLFAALFVFAACGQDSPPEPQTPAASPPPASPPPAEPAQPIAEPAPPPAQPQGSPEEPSRVEEILAKVEAGLALAKALQEVVESAAERAGEIPDEFDDASVRAVPPSAGVRSIGIEDEGTVVVDYAPEGDFQGGTIELKPTLGDDGVTWDCSGGTLPAQYRPEDCGE